MTRSGELRHALLALLLTAAVLVAVFAVLAAPALAERATLHERRAQLQTELAAYERAAARAPALRRQLDQLHGRKDNRSGFFEPMLPALAAAELQRRITALINEHKATLVSTQVQAASSDTPFPRIGIRVQMRADVESMTAIFHGLTGSVPVLLLDNVLIQSQNAARRTRGSAGADVLDVQFDLYGFMYATREGS